ncbi:DUF6233 domain-containing protein [Streptomyces sp. NPDC059761]|uniref:DUF6233 domain-containing protein n=1 Tax=Streptomyces sp. NPDC059761 TaxID=3346937 RepID=UPI003656CA30
MYRIGVPLWQTAARGGVEPADHSTWVTAEQLRPLPGVDLGHVPAHPRTHTSAPTTEDCPNATDCAHPLGTRQVLNALARPGTTACTVCGAVESLLPILAHRQDDVPAPGD